jgi:small subunit ribosomal protein S34
MTSSRAAATTLSKVLQRVIAPTASPALSGKSGNLYEVLARQPLDGVGSTVYQTRWTGKGIKGSRWEVSRVDLKGKGDRGKAWGYLVWKGMLISERIERARAEFAHRQEG